MANIPEESLTLENYLKGSTNLTYKDFCYYAKSDTSGLIKPIANILDDYREEIFDNVESYNLSTEDVSKYKFNPKRLSYDLYGTVDWYSFILYINEMSSVKEFSLTDKKIKLIDKTTMETILSTIYNYESPGLSNYNNKALS